MDIAFMNHRDDVRVDPDRIQALQMQLGVVGAENVITRAMTELSVRFSQLQTANAETDREAIYKLARGMSAIADQVGMVTLAQVASDVAASVNAGDNAAIQATLSRLCRIGECSLTLAWELSGQRI
jgi:hypothetical protein